MHIIYTQVNDSLAYMHKFIVVLCFFIFIFIFFFLKKNPHFYLLGLYIIDLPSVFFYHFYLIMLKQKKEKVSVWLNVGLRSI